MQYYCTYFDKKYLDRGLALYASLDRHCLPFHLWVLALCNDTLKYLQQANLPNVTVISMAGFETPDLLATKSGRTWPEYIWTCTGSLMVYVLARNPGIDHLSYLDADLFFYDHPRPIFAEIGTAPVGITPHRSSPSHQWMAPRNGLYNVGLVYAKANREGVGCIQEWAADTIDWCFYKYADGKFCDQKYLDAWPERWGAHSIQHKGANLAPWNQGEKQYTYSIRNGQVYVDDDPLIFYHFHAGLSFLHPKVGYEIDPFVAEHIYGPYQKALARESKKIC